MFDMRAYVTSLVAVFLALGIGILLGTVIVEKGTVSKQQSNLLKSIESKVNDVASDNRELKQTLEISEQFQNGILPLAIQGRLTGQNIAVLHTESTDIETLKAVEEVVKGASGTSFIITLKNKAFDKSISNMTELEALKNRSPQTESAESEVKDDKAPIAGLVAEAVAAPGKDLNIQKLKEKDIVSVSSDDAQVFSAILVVLNPKDSRYVTDFFSPLISDISQFGLPVTVAEPSAVSDSMVHKLKNRNVSTIDSVDRVWGKVSLVYALTGKAGNYGQKPGANTFLPVPSEDL